MMNNELEQLERSLARLPAAELYVLGKDLIELARYLRLHGREEDGDALARLVQRSALQAAAKTGRIPQLAGTNPSANHNTNHTELEALRTQTPPPPKPRASASIQACWPSFSDERRAMLKAMAEELEMKLNNAR